MKKEAQDTDKSLAVVFDEEGNAVRSVTKQFRQEAEQLDASIEEDVLILAYKLFVMKAKKYYLALGFSSWGGYCAAKEISLRQSDRYVLIGQRFGPYIYKEENGEILPADSTNGKNWTPVSSLGMRRLTAIASKLPEEDFKKLMSENFVEGPSGERIGWEDFKDMLSTEVERRLAERVQPINSKASKKIAQQDEQIKLLKKENETFRDRDEFMTMIEQKFGPGARQLREKMEFMQMAYDHFRDATVYLTQANIEPDDPDEVLERLQQIVKNFELWKERIVAKYKGLVIEAFTDSRSNEYS